MKKLEINAMIIIVMVGILMWGIYKVKTTYFPPYKPVFYQTMQWFNPYRKNQERVINILLENIKYEYKYRKNDFDFLFSYYDLTCALALYYHNNNEHEKSKKYIDISVILNYMVLARKLHNSKYYTRMNFLTISTVDTLVKSTIKYGIPAKIKEGEENEKKLFTF